MSNNYRIAAIGDRDSVLGFRALGLEAHFAETPAEAKAALSSLAGEAAIIYITEQLAIELKNEIDRYKEQLTPAIVPIPSKTGALGLGMSILKDAVERAVGADILET